MEISKSVVSKKMQDEEVLLELRSGTYYGLNQTGTFLFEKIKAGTTKAKLIQALTEEFDVDLQSAQQDVQVFIDDLQKQNLICGDL